MAITEDLLTVDGTVCEDLLTGTLTEDLLTGDGKVSEDLLTRDGAVSEDLLTGTLSEDLLTGDGSVSEDLLTGDRSVSEDLLTGDGSEDLLTGDGTVSEDLLTGDGSVSEDLLTGDRSVSEDLLTGDGSEDLLTGDGVTISEDLLIGDGATKDLLIDTFGVLIEKLLTEADSRVQGEDHAALSASTSLTELHELEEIAKAGHGGDATGKASMVEAETSSTNALFDELTKRKHFLPSELVYDSKNSLKGFPRQRMDFFQFLVVPLPAQRSNSQGVKISEPRWTQRLDPLYKSVTHKLAFNEPHTTSKIVLPGEVDDMIQLPQSLNDSS